jgi:anti-sigma regulatory factor (Ser/Thr protein kinase)
LKPGSKIQLVKITNSNQKNDAVDAIRGLLVSAKFQNRMATVIASAVDELLMNACFDAPIDEMGKHIYSLTPRSTI